MSKPGAIAVGLVLRSRMPVIKWIQFILFALPIFVPCCDPVFAAKVLPRWECVEALHTDLGPPAPHAARLEDLLAADSGPTRTEKVMSPTARAHARVKWIDRPSFWPYIKLLASGHDESAKNFRRVFKACDEAKVFDLFEAYRASYKAKIRTNDSFTIRNPGLPVNSRYSRSNSSADLDLIYRGMRTRIPHEILQIRAVLAGGAEKTMFEIEGTDEVPFDPRAAAEKTLEMYRAKYNEFRGLLRFDLVHNHPGEPLFLILKTGETKIETLDLTPEDIEMAKQYKKWIGNFNVSVTALIGLRPGMITRSSYSPSGRYR